MPTFSSKINLPLLVLMIDKIGKVMKVTAEKDWDSVTLI